MKQQISGIQCYTRLWQEANKMYEDWALRHGLSYCELLVVLSLAQGDTTQIQICEKWQLSKQTVHTILKLFVKQDWVSLEEAIGDKRKKNIVMSKQGSEYFNQVSDELEALEQKVWHQMGEANTNTLLTLTADYNQLFQEEAHEK